MYYTQWIPISEQDLLFILNESLDQVFISFCKHISKRVKSYETYKEFVHTEIKIKRIQSKIDKLRSQIKRENQFNKKIRLNIELNKSKLLIADLI